MSVSLPSKGTSAFKFPLPGTDMGYDREFDTAYPEEMAMKQVTVRLPEYMHEEFTKLAQKNNLPIASYIRGVLGEYLHLETRMEHLESTVNQCKGQVEHLLHMVGGKGQKVSRASALSKKF